MALDPVAVRPDAYGYRAPASALPLPRADDDGKEVGEGGHGWCSWLLPNGLHRMLTAKLRLRLRNRSRRLKLRQCDRDANDSGRDTPGVGP